MPSAKTTSTLTFKPLTKELWKDFESLFGQRGACGGCWCMSWRLSRAEFNANKGERNRESMKRIVASGPAPGILAFDGERAVGWCAVAPRERYPALARSRIFAPIDSQSVWSISCIFIAKPYRNKGVSSQLIKAAVDLVRKQGGKIVEGYPQDLKEQKLPDAFVWTGLSPAFKRAGFHVAARRSAKRPIMRYKIGS
jgi:GNAT superfamily N-acetyltransferase